MADIEWSADWLVVDGCEGVGVRCEVCVQMDKQKKEKRDGQRTVQKETSGKREGERGSDCLQSGWIQLCGQE